MPFTTFRGYTHERTILLLSIATLENLLIFLTLYSDIYIYIIYLYNTGLEHDFFVATWYLLQGKRARAISPSYAQNRVRDTSREEHLMSPRSILIKSRSLKSIFQEKKSNKKTLPSLFWKSHLKYKSKLDHIEDKMDTKGKKL